MESGVALRFPPQSKTLRVFAKYLLAQMGEAQTWLTNRKFFSAISL
jgi:hypothetical protein